MKIKCCGRVAINTGAQCVDCPAVFDEFRGQWVVEQSGLPGERSRHSDAAPRIVDGRDAA